jgi:hypothetical protein
MSETIDKLILNNNLEEAITQCSNENKYSLCKLLCLIGNIQVNKLPKVKVISQVKQEHRKAQLDKQLDKLSYELIESIDYSTMSPTKEIYNLCKGNDFRYKKGIVADALNHYNLWKRLLDDKENEYYIILEDTFDDKTSIRLNELSNNLSNEFLYQDMLFLGSSKYSVVNNNINYVCLIDKKLDSIEMHAYSINKCGAQKCVNYIQQNGLKHRIQDILSIIPNLDIYKYCNPVTFTQKLYLEGYNEELDFLSVYKSNYTFIPSMDHVGDDLYRKSVPLHEQFMIADDDPNCAGFNTLGFFKKKVTKLEKSQYFRENDGIYIKKQIGSLTKSNEKRIRVKMMCNWCSSESLCKEWSNMCENGFSWKNIDITWTDENIDYYVIINSPPRDSYYDPKRTIVFQMEPWVYDLTKNWGVRTWGYWAKPDPSVFMAVRGRHSDCHNNAFWQLELSLKQLLTLKAEKTEVISSICSSKYFDEGHIARIDLLKYIESKNDSSINIHVYNQDNKHNFKHYKGPVSPYIDKSKGMLKYKYYFMIENNYEKDFITEKIWEPILCESLVFYYGCPNVSKYINSNAYVLLDITDFEKSYQIIKRAIEEDWWSKRIDSIREEKRKILEEMAFFPIIHKIIHESTM